MASPGFKGRQPIVLISPSMMLLVPTQTHRTKCGFNFPWTDGHLLPQRGEADKRRLPSFVILNDVVVTVGLSTPRPARVVTLPLPERK